MANLVSFGWIVSILLLFLYSFTQINLGLTLTRASFWQPIQKSFQSIGYFNRPLSTGFYLGILFLLFTFYFLLLWLAKKDRLSFKNLWWLIGLTAGILLFSYPAFSHDLFNYIFDAKVVTFYHQNPYQHKALDFPGDPMLGFIHWTHRTYPYGPLWLFFTVPLSILGFQKLLPTMILFKGLGLIGYLGSAWFIYKILEELKPKVKLIGLVIFAFNPLVVIESLVSAHNDILMMMLVLSGFWFLFKKRYILAWLMLVLSAGIKFATGLLLPIFLGVSFYRWQKRKINWEKIWLVSFFMMVAALFLATKRTELQPWYLLFPLPFIALLPEKNWLFWPTTSLSLGLLLHYAPFLYLGNWDPPVPAIKLKLTLLFLTGGIFISVLDSFKKSSVMVK
jgi:hypothetical protein